MPMVCNPMVLSTLCFSTHYVILALPDDHIHEDFILAFFVAKKSE